MKRKGQTSLGDIPNFVYVLLMIGLMIGAGLIVLGSLKETGWAMYNTSTNNGSDFNDSIDTTVSAMQEIPDWLSLLIVVVFIAIVITLISLLRARSRD